MQWKRNVKAITDVVQALQAKTISAIQAKVQLGMLGMNPDRIDSLLADIEDDGQMNDPQNVQDLAESFAGHCSSRWRMLREGSPPFIPVAESGGGNPNHDPSNGQFASGGGSSGGGGPKFTRKPDDPPQVSPRAARTAARSAKGPASSQPAVDTASPKFKSWFGGSKIVDEHGKPQVMYHGTDEHFTKFDMSKFGDRDPGDYGRGIYFTHSEANGQMYAEWAKGGGKTPKDKQRVMPVYLKIEKPFHADEPLTHELATKIVEDANVSRKAKGKEPIDVGSHAKRLLDEYNMAEEGWTKSRSKVRAGILQNYINSEGLARLGYDGVIGKAEVVAFDPRQVKSAVGNSGAFDPNSHDIHE